jgi:hypothetical protein
VRSWRTSTEKNEKGKREGTHDKKYKGGEKETEETESKSWKIHEKSGKRMRKRKRKRIRRNEEERCHREEGREGQMNKKKWRD